MSTKNIDRLTEQARLTRGRVSARAAELRVRTDPSELADDLMNFAAGKAQTLTSQARTLAAAHPVAIGAGIAAVALALFTKRQLSHAEIELGDDYSDYDDSFSSSPPAAESSINPLVSILSALAAGAFLGLLSADKK